MYEKQKRIKLDDQTRKNLFDLTLSKNNISLYELSRLLNVGYSGIKNWKSGRNLIPYKTFYQLLELNNLEFRDNILEGIIEECEPNWGAKLGGKNYLNRDPKQVKAQILHARKFIKNKIMLPTTIDYKIWELLGVALGDGCLSKYFSKSRKREIFEFCLTGSLSDDFDYYSNYLVPLIRKRFNSRVSIHTRPNEGAISLNIKSKILFDFFKDLGMPVGRKKYVIRLPEGVLKGNEEIKAAVLRGLLDTDGCMYARKDENYRYLHIKITSANRKFLNQLNKLIRDFGINSYVHWMDDHGGDLIVRGNDNVKRWMLKVGTSHSVINNRYDEWIKSGKLLPKGS